MSDAPTVSIADAIPAAVQIPVRELRATDRVFTATGEPRELVYVTHYTRGVMFRRADQRAGTFEWWDYHDADGAEQTATVLRSA